MDALRIGLDATPTINGAGGIARYVHGVVGGLEGQPQPPELRQFAVGRAAIEPAPGIRHCRWPLRVVAASWARGGPPSVERLVGPVDTVHTSGSVLPVARAPIVAVVHDLAPIDHPELHPARWVDQLRSYLASLDRAAAVLTVSQATADRVIDAAPRADVHVAPNGRTPFPAPVEPPLRGRPYVLAVGAPIPRKDYRTLVEAMARVDASVQLVVVGVDGSDDEALRQLAHELGLADRFHRARSVSDAELAGWYAAAAAVAVPSVAEGFSLPIIEAQHAGVPVVASDIAVHREVAGGAASLVPVSAADALAEALVEVLAGGPAVAERTARGRTNAERYTWEACAEATLRVHRSVAG